MSIELKHVIVPVASAMVLAGGFTWLGFKDAKPARAQESASAPNVEVSLARKEQITEWKSFSGRIEAVDEVEVRPLVSGAITAIHFSDGDLVKKDAPLFTIDQGPYRAELDRALGEQAAAETAAEFARTDFERAEKLVRTAGLSQRDFDLRKQAMQENVAKLLIANAAVASAKINLDRTVIRAPIEGRVSRAELTVGNVVQAGNMTAPLTRIVSVSKAYAAFDADEQSYLTFMKGRNGHPVEVQLGLADEGEFPRRGIVVSVDNSMDVKTGTIRVRALFDNSDGVLIPGLYAKIRMPAGSPSEAVLVSAKAIGTDQDKKYVFVVDDKNTVSYREIYLGSEQGTYRIVRQGLAEGDRVVVAGAQAVRPGETVTVEQSDGDNQ
ncbi:efflux RND transporter periplasmic adaptor subunit [Rhizobium mesosinicum]|uniref:Efflux RND transporter periplasmic adaptor subunit n=1 Tax=Rhizobium mesosinicum TaxID=335017 RepID=A0ABS7GMS8_9HYPH|nr:efflux RND transporter periplasmic adaptor subunit [Rhizobium mesosinicum]MBW9051092.1 efflux RND transporter periplasmic adaptor subunit [Rhizobium mesosinicum]